MFRLHSAVHVFVLLVLFLPIMAGSVSGGEEAEAQLSTRIFHVGGLTIGKSDFLGERPPPVGPDEVADEDFPLFGGEAEEPSYPVGQVDELIERIKNQIDPTSWQRVEGAYIRCNGEKVLIVRHRPEVLDEIARWLAQLEQRVFRTAVIDVRARRAVPGVAGGELGPSLTLAAFLNQRVTGFSGSQYAYLGDYDVEVAKGSMVSDPIVSVANLGLSLDVRVIPGGSPQQISVDVRVWLADLAEARQVSTGEHRSVDVPVFDLTQASAVMEVVPGRWTPLAGRSDPGGWSFDLRVSIFEAALPSASSAPFRIAKAPPSDRTQPPPTRLFGIQDLGARPVPSRARRIHLVPSNYRAPVPPELGYPSAILPPESIVEFLREISFIGDWEDPASLEVRHGLLIARNQPAVLTGIGKALAQLRREFLWSVSTSLDVVEMPAAMLEDLRRGVGGAFVLTGPRHEALLAAIRAGRAKRMGRIELLSRDGVPNTVASGRHISYLSDYEVELAEESSIANPVIQEFFTGLQLVVTTSRTSGDEAIAMEVRAARTQEAAPMRLMQAPLGTIELPHLKILRIDTGLLVPVGATVLLAAQGEGKLRRVLLLTPTLRRRP